MIVVPGPVEYWDAQLNGHGFGADAAWRVLLPSAGAKVAVNVRAGAVFGVVLAVAAAVQL
ncbi:hypothetical protein ACX80V_03950 [Arthrobacter sp. MDT3-24]